MKILHVLAQIPAKTGSGVYFSNVIQRLCGYGYEQRALFACQDGLRWDILSEDKQYPVCFKTPALPFPIPGMSDVMPYHSTVYGKMDEGMIDCWRRAFRDALLQAKEEFAPDVVILHHMWMLTALAIEVFDASVKIGVCHNTDIRQALQNPALREKYVANLHGLDAVLTLSPGQGETLAAVFGIPPEITIPVGGGFNEEVFHPAARKTPHGGVRLAFAGKLSKAKGVFELVAAFGRLVEEDPALRLTIIGSGDEESTATLKALAEKTKGVTLVPAVPQAQLAHMLRQQDIFVLPSYYEGICLIAIEALACGLWTVTTEIESLMALLGSRVNQSGVIEYVPLPRLYDTDKPHPGDIGAFTEALAQKLRLQVQKVKDGQAFPAWAGEDISRHSWGNIIQKINDVILAHTK